MKINDLMKLIDAGFSKEDIFNLLGENDPAPEAPADPAPEAPADPAPEASAPFDDKRLKEIETKLNYVVDRFNYMAVQNSKQPEQQNKETIEDILSTFVK